MFAVSGWSVPTGTINKETEPAKNSSSTGNDGSAGPAANKPKSRKRKRGGAPTEEEVTEANVNDLFETVVEGKKPKKDNNASRDHSSTKQNKTVQDGGDKEKKKKKQKQKKQSDGDVVAPPAEATPDKKAGGKKQSDGDVVASPAEATPDSNKADGKKQKKSKDAPSSDTQAAPKPAEIAPFKTPAPKLTPLQASMRQKLISARFRHLNETLYTRPSKEAYTLFQDSPEMFDEYHEGFRRQVKVWPENPVDSFLSDIRRRGKAKPPPRKRPGQNNNNNNSKSSGPAALPRTAGTCTIADLGCGDARLAESLQSDKDKLHLQVHSYDLQSPSPLVTKADIANLPLVDGSVNVAIFCLALMGTNWTDFIEEAYRILHWKGELWVAEIKSRFAPPRSKNAVVNHSVGHRKKKGAKGGGGDDAAAAEGQFEDDLAVEVDGADDRRRETDVSAFVEVLRKRGFVLAGERNEAIDLSNRMFVKMHFIKGAEPTKGKGVKQDKGPAAGGKRRFPGSSRRDADEQEDDDDADEREASTLKPCVYKIR